MKVDLENSEFVNSFVDRSWTYCFNAECPRSAECIRYISSRFKPQGVTIGNAVYPDACQHGECQHFMRVMVVKTAWGMSALYDQVKHCHAQMLKYKVMSVLGGKTAYYRVHRGEKHLSPDKQQEVNALFAQYGYPAPQFDHYKEEIDFAYR